MINFANIEKYRENNRIEAKKALGGLPHSIWETYSAFANTMGGIILLGVEEYRDHSLHPVDLPDPEGMIEKFRALMKNPQKASVNILSEKDVTIETVDGKRIIAIRVPRAQRMDKPVFVDGNPFSGSYRRSGEGDYRCTKEEVEAMLRDATVKSQDMAILETADLTALDSDSVKRYRARYASCHPEAPLAETSDTDFLLRLGAIGRGAQETLHPTAAGLLLLGKEREIVQAFPSYQLEYSPRFQADPPFAHPIVSFSGKWSGNLFDFYFLAEQQIAKALQFENGIDPESTPIFQAAGEALANCLLNADYHGAGGIQIIQQKERITLSNPGGFRIDIEDAKTGGISDPRNSALTKLLNGVGIGKGTGGGLSTIFSIWKKQGWIAPQISEQFEPDRITLSLFIGRSGKQAITSALSQQTTRTKSYIQKQAIVDYLTEKITAKAGDIAKLLGVKEERARRLLSQMVADGTLAVEGSPRRRIYKLKA